MTLTLHCAPSKVLKPAKWCSPCKVWQSGPHIHCTETKLSLAHTLNTMQLSHLYRNLECFLYRRGNKQLRPCKGTGTLKSLAEPLAKPRGRTRQYNLKNMETTGAEDRVLSGTKGS